MRMVGCAVPSQPKTRHSSASVWTVSRGTLVKMVNCKELS